MRNLNRNKRPIYYALQTGETADIDEYGNETGETTPVYGPAAEMKCNISAATGQEAVQAFGTFTGYNRIICVSDPGCPIEETSIVWFNAAPPDPHNYIVVRKADSVNGILYALQEVKVT